jgi:hypothetical protein
MPSPFCNICPLSLPTILFLYKPSSFFATLSFFYTTCLFSINPDMLKLSCCPLSSPCHPLSVTYVLFLYLPSSFFTYHPLSVQNHPLSLPLCPFSTLYRPLSSLYSLLSSQYYPLWMWAEVQGSTENIFQQHQSSCCFTLRI